MLRPRHAQYDFWAISLNILYISAVQRMNKVSVGWVSRC